MSDIKIIVVHNNTKVLDLIEKTLNDAGFADIDTASDANSAISMMADKDYDLVMSSYNMEYISGLYFLKMIREHDGLKHIKFIMMFVDMNRDLFVGAIDAGADAYIHMPYDPVRLKKSIDNIFDTVP